MKLFLSLVLALWGMGVSAGAQDPDIEANEKARIEEIFRTSEQPGEVPVSRRGRQGKTKRVSAPPGSYRIGCICMDDKPSDTRSTGACSGHGGVRFWVYRTREGDTVHILTGRHERHPHPLDAQEMSALSQKQLEKTARLKQPQAGMAPGIQPVIIAQPAAEEGNDWPESGSVAVASVFLFFTLRMTFRWADRNQPLIKYALRHLLRYRKRPPTDKGGEDPGAQRLL